MSTNLHPFLVSRATDGGIHRRCTPEVKASAMSWLGQPPTAEQAALYEAKRASILAQNERSPR